MQSAQNPGAVFDTTSEPISRAGASLQAMLQVSLLGLALAVRPITAGPAAQAQYLKSLALTRPKLGPSRPGQGSVRYISGLPLALSTLLAPTDSQTLALTLAKLWPMSSSSLTSSLTQSVAIHTSLQVLPAGKISLSPNFTALKLWLRQIVNGHQPAAEATRYNFPADFQPGFSWGATPMAQRLQLSPLAFIHHIYGQCHRLSGSQPGTTEPDWDPIFAVELEQSSDLEPLLLWHLVNFVDQRVAQPLALGHRARAGYHLAAAADTWLIQQSQLNTLTVGSKVLLKGIAQELGELLAILQP